MPVYDEAKDFKGHLDAIRKMDARLSAAGVNIDLKDATVLDVGGAGGLHAGIIATRARRVHLADIQDQNDRWNGEFVKLLAKKFQRNGIHLPLDRIEFNMTDAHHLIYRDNCFDFVVSFDAFEHIPNPELALTEICRVLRPGGLFYCTFDPIWTADTGSHFSHLVPEPWAHLRMAEPAFIECMRKAGATESTVDAFLHKMNRWRLSQFDHLLGNFASAIGLNRLWGIQWKGTRQPKYIETPQFLDLTKNFSEEELLTRGLSAIFRKR